MVASCLISCFLIMAQARQADAAVGDIPLAAPDDAVMAPASEVGEVRSWAEAAFTGAVPAGRGPHARTPGSTTGPQRSPLRAVVHGNATPDRGQRFARGLGTHARSEIVVGVLPGTKAFEAQVGIDNNDDTGGVRGSVQFAVAAGGREASFEPPPRKGGEPPIPVHVRSPRGRRNSRSSSIRLPTERLSTRPTGPKPG